jgi:aminobenzoyl-glutamate transport protein
MQNGKHGVGIFGAILNGIEKVGNMLPEPATLFVIGAVLVMVISHVGHVAGWSVQPLSPRAVTQPVVDASGAPVLDAATGQPKTQPMVDPGSGRPKIELIPEGEPLRPRSLLTADGLYWCVSNIVRNFTNFAPLGIVLTGMLGVGVAEKTGLFGALMRIIAVNVPRKLLTPTIIFLGINSSIGSDSGYIVLPALAGALFAAVGRSPLAGIAAAFAGVAGGFSASLLISGGDALVAGITEQNARILNPSYAVAATCNWWFMIASTFLVTLVGWAVTAWFVEPRMTVRPESEGGPIANASGVEQISALDLRALKVAGLVFAVVMGGVLALIRVPGAPLYGTVVMPQGHSVDRWTQVIVPIVFLAFIAPGMAFGMVTGAIKSEKEAIGCMVDAIKSIAPIIVMAFFAAQFIEYFNHSNLGRMLAMAGGEALAGADLSPMAIVVLFVLVCATINLFVASMSAKYLVVAPIFIPMFMMLGMSPELTQVAYRVGDSCTNIVTPMNSYMVIILAVMQKYAKNAGMGTIISTMLPYSVIFLIVWISFLVLWIWMGWPLGKPGPLWYAPA